MGIYKFSYKNLRRNKIRSINTILKIAFGVIVFLVLIGSGIGINTILGSGDSDNGIVSADAGNKNQIINTTLSNINNTVNSILGPDLSNSAVAGGIRTILRNLLSLLDIMASIIFLVGVFAVNYAMDMNLTERRKEIGLLYYLGFTRRQVMLSLIFEAALLGLLGAIIGTTLVVLGVVVLSTLIKIELLSITMPLWLPVLAVSLTTMFSALLPLYSIWFHTGKDPVEALRL
jgi:putative ABC transport system permease protein